MCEAYDRHIEASPQMRAEIEAEEKRLKASKAKRDRKNAARRERDQIRRDLGLTRVRGALGGVYWE